MCMRGFITSPGNSLPVRGQRLYSDLARYYDRVYHWKDYEDDARRIVSLVDAFKTSDGNSLLDLGCGTGGHLEHLTDRFVCTGLDMEEAMLGIAREKVPRARFVQGDMLDFELGETFDVIICMFSTVGYARSREELAGLMGMCGKHLRPGGVVLIEPWLVKEAFKPHHVGFHTYDGEDAKIARMSRVWIEGVMTVLEFHYLIGEPDREIMHLTDRHELRLFDLDEAMALMEEAGLRPSFDEKGFGLERGALIGTK